jgi:hypothetical protein
MSRISAERMAKAQEQLRTIPKDDHAKVKAIANIVRPLRSFLFKTPDDYGMTGWHDLFIPSDDHPTLGKMTVGLYSQCMGGNSQYEAISRQPERFKNVKCMCSPLVPSMSAIFQAFSELQGVAQYQELSTWSC